MPPPSAGAGTSVRHHRPGPASLLALRPGQTEFDDMQLAALRQLGIGNPNRADLAVFFHQCRRTGLDPFLKQIYLITRMTWNPDTQQREPRATIQTGIDGFRLVVRRGAVDVLHAKLHHEGPLWCGVDGVWRDIWPNPDEPPLAARYTIFLDGEPFPGIAHFHEFAATKDEYAPDRMENGRKIKGQKTGRKVPSGKWVSPAEGGMPAHMLAKCAEALASRKAFPQDLSGIYIDEEMERLDVEGRVVPNGKLVIEGPGEPSGRDWLAEIEATESGDEVNELWFEIKSRGELTAELQAAITMRGVHFRDLLRQQQSDSEESDPDSDPEPEADR